MGMSWVGNGYGQGAMGGYSWPTHSCGSGMGTVVKPNAGLCNVVKIIILLILISRIIYIVFKFCDHLWQVFYSNFQVIMKINIMFSKLFYL